MDTQVRDNPGAESPLADLRTGPLSGIEPLLRSMGYDPAPVFSAAGIDPDDFRDVDHRIPYASAPHLLGQCAKITGADQFGLLLGQFFLLPQLGIPGLLATTASNVGAALHDIVHHFDLHDRGGVVTLNTFPRNTFLGYAITILDAEAIDQVYDLTITICCATLRSLCGPQWNPTRVELMRSQPKEPQLYKDYFRAPVVYNSTRNAVVFSNKWLDYPLATADEHYHKDFVTSARSLHHAMPNSVSLETRSALHSRMSQTDCNAAAIAALLGMGERTLHRRLQCEGTNFRKLLDETRRVSSWYYLRSTALPINSIATALGYGSTDAFDHAFKRWYGNSPKQWRDSARSSR
ncbi:MAG: AraC family transcriptional regulator ligand-binding domain-containing protein [Halioglobus sp.]|nr:AraC family transcriptional regulator ligand-binding domain-containing protein [Halioglobus sp.]